LLGASALACARLFVPSVLEYTCPCPHKEIVVMPPVRRVAPLATSTAVVMLVNLILLRTNEEGKLLLLASRGKNEY
jgi:hypothetical protein